ncbi:MAG: YhjD/YihY/BrkB family envelope integrity protein [Phycisphaerales bacterium]
MFERLKSSFGATIKWVKTAITQPRHELTRWESAARFAYDLGRYGERQLRQDKAPQMASALSFHTLFGLLPVLVVATVVARTLLGRDEFMGMADRVLSSLGLYTIDLARASEDATAAAAPTDSIGLWLHNLIDQSMGLNLAALGWVGLLVVMYTAISLMVTVENSFNAIYRAPEGRPWVRRVPLYWFVLTISPIAIGITIMIDGAFTSMFDSFPLWGWLLKIINIIWTLVMIWLIMYGAYSLIPNTRVQRTSTLVGSLVAALTIYILIQGLGVYFDRAVSFSKVYGSLGLIPLFMFWVYLMWLAILFGLEVAAILHNLQGRRLDELEKKPAASQPLGLIDPAAVVTLMQQIAEKFEQGQSIASHEIAGTLGMAESQVARIIEHLERSGLLFKVERPEDTWTLSRPPDQISVETLLETAFGLADEGRTACGSILLARLRTAQLKAASEFNLAALVRGEGASLDLLTN